MQETAGSTSDSAIGVALRGNVHGGQQVISNSKIYLYAVSTSGYSTAATSLLGGSGYVTTGVDGSFSITGTYTCPAEAYVYALALGGNPGLAPTTNNSEIALMNGVGACSALTSGTVIQINEVTTVATAYALAQFMSSEALVGTSSTNVIGLENAFSTITDLVDPVSGLARATTPPGNATVPQAEINSLANALAACVNSDGTGAPCSTLMTAAGVTGGGGTPIDTIQAAINIAHNPATNVTAIYGLGTPNNPFQPSLSPAPADWTMSLVYTGGGISLEYAIAADATGNIWAVSHDTNILTEISPQGSFLSGTAGYTNVSLNGTFGLAIDLSNNVWIGSERTFDPNTHATVYDYSLQKFSSNGVPLSGVTGYTGNCLSSPFSIAIDANSNVWTGNIFRLCEFSGSGTQISTPGSSTGGGLQDITYQLAVNPTGDIWGISGTVGPNTSSVIRFSGSTGAPISSTGYPISGSTGALSLAFDHSGNVWAGTQIITNGFITGGSIFRFDGNGNPLTPTTTFTNTWPKWLLVDGNGHVWSNAPTTSGNSTLSELANDGTSISPAAGFAVPLGGYFGAIDGSGNLWESSSGAVVETVGIAAPVVTPLVKAVATNSLGVRP